MSSENTQPFGDLEVTHTNTELGLHVGFYASEVWGKLPVGLVDEGIYHEGQPTEVRYKLTVSETPYTVKEGRWPKTKQAKTATFIFGDHYQYAFTMSDMYGQGYELTYQEGIQPVITMNLDSRVSHYIPSSEKPLTDDQLTRIGQVVMGLGEILGLSI